MTPCRDEPALAWERLEETTRDSNQPRLQEISSWHLERKTEDVTHQDRDLIPENVYKDQSTKLHIKTTSWSSWISDCIHSESL